MRNDFIEHSAKGTSWKKGHKYIRKEGDRYIYEEKKEPYNIADEFVDTPDIQGGAQSLDRIEPVRKTRDVLNTPIWTPKNYQEKGLVNKGADKIASMFKNDKKKQVAKK
jgi:hypothetical protein